MDPRTPRPFACEYVTWVARAYADRAGQPAPPVVRANYVNLYTCRVGVKVQAWFSRNNPRKTPELRVGVAFDAYRREVNARAADAFAATHADELQALGAEPWPTDSGNDRRFMTRIAVPKGEEGLDEVVRNAAELAGRYVELLRAAMA